MEILVSLNKNGSSKLVEQRSDKQLVSLSHKSLRAIRTVPSSHTDDKHSVTILQKRASNNIILNIRVHLE
jgi:hypothetical protein